MINTSEQRVLIHIPIEPAQFASNGGNIKSFRLAQGGCYAEYADGNIFLISHPMEQWILDVTGMLGITVNTGDNINLYFTFDAQGMYPNPGNDDNLRSITGIETFLG